MEWPGGKSKWLLSEVSDLEKSTELEVGCIDELHHFANYGEKADMSVIEVISLGTL